MHSKMSSSEDQLNRYDFQKQLMSHYSTTYKILCLKERVACTIKLFELANKFHSQCFLNEVAIYTSLNSLADNSKFLKMIKPVQYINDHKDKIDGIIMEYAKFGSLRTILDKQELNEDSAKIIFKEIVLCVEQLHNLNIVHGDLQLPNFLVDSKFNLKLADFDLAFFANTQNIKSHKDLIFYNEIGQRLPKGLFNQDIDSFIIDIYQLGLILFELVTESEPYSNFKLDRCGRAIENNNFKIFWQTQKTQYSRVFSTEFKDLFEKLVGLKSLQKISISEILEHPWLTSIQSSKDCSFLLQSIIQPIQQ